MTQAIRRYITRNLKKETPVVSLDTKPKKVKLIYTIRDVIKQQYRDLVEKEIPHKSTDKEYLGQYQKAVSKVLNNMSDDQKEEAENLLNSWNKDGAPREVQIKWVI